MEWGNRVRDSRMENVYITSLLTQIPSCVNEITTSVINVVHPKMCARTWISIIFGDGHY